jgi:adhesin/invasin
MQRGITLAGGWLGNSGRGYLVVAALAIVGASACSDNNSTTAPLTATTITTNAATNGQSGDAGTALAQPVGVTVFDQNGAPLANATVNWAVESGGGSVASPTSVTDANGNATIVWTLGPTIGTDSLKASIAGGEDAFATATVVPGPASAVHITSGDPQTVTAGSSSAPLVVQVVDQFANPVPNVTVTWTVAGGGTLSATSTTTDATGSTQVTLTTDAAPANYTVTATTGGITPVTFTIAAN